MEEIVGLVRTDVLIKRGVPQLLEGQRHRAGVYLFGDKSLTVLLDWKEGVVLGLMEEGSWSRLFVKKATEVQGVVSGLRLLNVEVRPELIELSDDSKDVAVDLEDLVDALTPFPDEPNAEICVITGGRANARVDSSLPLLSGWFGSAVADGMRFVVVDETLPIGPICDEEVEKALAAGQIVEIGVIPRAELADMPDKVIRTQLEYGITIFYELVEQEKMMPSLGVGLFNAPLVQPFMPWATGEKPANEIDLIAVGKLMAMGAHAQGRPLKGKLRDKAVEEALKDLRKSNGWTGSLES